MEIVVIGDLHGLSIWKQIVNQHPNCDKVIFMGDYFDSKKEFVASKDQLTNFDEVLAFKRLNPEKVILLIGNHDFHYFSFVDEKYGGYQPLFADLIQTKLDRAFARNWIQACYIHEDLLFTHAGVSQKWCNTYAIDANNVQNGINELLNTNFNAFSHLRDSPKSPFWVRPIELENDTLPFYKQIVGHTQQSSIKIGANLVLVDALTTANEYLLVKNGKFSVSIVYKNAKPNQKTTKQAKS